LLVVEDEAIVRADLNQTLSDLGYDVVASTSSGELAVALALASEPDAVLMDITLRGGMDGVDASKKIRQSADVPVIFMTAHSDARTMLRVKETAHAGYLQKPFEDRLLAETVEKVLSKRDPKRILTSLLHLENHSYHRSGINE
jgi:CheY-like chemotaxis protein